MGGTFLVDITWSSSSCCGQRPVIKSSGAWPVIIHMPFIPLDLGHRWREVMHHLSDVRFEDPGTLRYVMRFLVHLGKNLLMPIYLWSATVPIIVALTAVGLSMTYLCAGVVTMPALSHAPCVIAVPASILIFWMVGL